MTYFGLALVFSSSIYIYLHRKSQYIDIVAEDPQGKSRIVRRFVIAKRLINHNKNCWEWQFICYRNIIQLYTFNDTWEDVGWATAQ